MKRTDLQDTSAWAHRALLDRLRQMTPEERLRIAFARTEDMREFRKRTRHLRP